MERTETLRSRFSGKRLPANFPGDLRIEFLEHVGEHDELTSVWMWKYDQQTTLVANALAALACAHPIDVLRRMYLVPDVSTRPAYR